MRSEVEFSQNRLRHLYRTSLDNNFKPIFFGEENSFEKFILWRHDVDIDIDDCLRMAKIEVEEGIKSTYFLMLNSAFYNLFSDQGEKLVYDLKNFGHNVSLHCDLGVGRNEYISDKKVEDKVSRDFELLRVFFGERVFDEIVSFHNPPSCLIRKSYSSFYSTYQNKFFENIKYLSDSNRCWREGAPERWLERSDIEKYSILLHPVIWAYPGVTMPECINHFIEKRTFNLRRWLREDDVKVD